MRSITQQYVWFDRYQKPWQRTRCYSRFFATYLTRFPIENDFRQEQRTATRSHWETLRLKKVEKRVVDSIGTRLGVPQCCSLGRATLIGLLLRARLGEPLRGMLGRIPPLRLSACGPPVRLRRTSLTCPLTRSVKRQGKCEIPRGNTPQIANSKFPSNKCSH